MVISLTTIPSRVKNLSGVELLIDQAEKIYIWMPRRVKRLKQSFDGGIPHYLRHPKIEFNVVTDLGPITKMVYMLDMPHDEFVVVDDDCIYRKGFLDGFIHKDRVQCYRGREFLIEGRYRKSKLYCGNHHGPVDIITATWGFWTKKEFFHGFTKSREFVKSQRDQRMRLVDDIVISSFLHNRGVPIWCVPLRSRITPIATLYVKNGLYYINRPASNEDYALENLWTKNKKHENDFNDPVIGPDNSRRAIK